MSNIQEIYINSIFDLINDLKTIDTKLWFRGQNNIDWHLLPSAYRRDSILESQTLNHFRLKAPAFYSACPDVYEYAKWLSLMQHHGLPTRLLDWSESPLIAIFFALNSKELNNPFIWALDAGSLNEEMNDGDNRILFLESKEISNTLCKEAFELTKNTCEKILAVTPRYIHERLDRQHSQFTIHGSFTALNKLSISNKFLKKYIINTSSINNMRNELSILDIRQSKLFPDLDNLANELKQLVVNNQ
jgi:hypothetical protein